MRDHCTQHMKYVNACYGSTHKKAKKRGTDYQALKMLVGLEAIFVVKDVLVGNGSSDCSLAAS